MPDRSTLVLVALGALIAVLLPLASYLDERSKAPRAEDVLLVSYPRSGSFWLRFLLAQAARGDSLNIDFHNLEDIFPDLEYGPNRAVYVGAEEMSTDYKEVRRERPRVRLPEIYKSHMVHRPGAEPPCDVSVGPGLHETACECPNCPEKWRRVIYLVRDGRDALCSYYNFQRNLGAENTADGFSDFLRAESLYPGVSWAEHVRSYLDLPTPGVASGASEEGPEVLWVRYEDLHADPAKELRRVLNFLGVRATDVVIREAVRKSEFSSMREQEEDGGLRLFDRHYSDRQEEFRVVRKGKIGSWEDCFGKNGAFEEAREAFNAENLDVMQKLGYVESARWR
uniref:Sulfotransferase domain-containing protein n=1 Tax=Phaeomonas parva TaxID=124430 RepID=A0A7S1U3P1_9STRA|mmetsp:Transcript_30160/g.96230  ORF Transcript_30160/g.96230 Transcript_30160/m.96230 type:complete len:339 (+) Transcript_30160:99-1115(+)